MSDLQAKALANLAEQYADSPKLQAVIALFVGECEEVRDAAESLAGLRTIAGSEGDGLDGLGQILGQPREIAGVIDLDFFEYHDGLGGPAAEGFGDTADASAGSRYRSIFEQPFGNKLLGDAEYRQMLRAKVVRNHGSATIDHIIASIYAVLGEVPASQGGTWITFSTAAQVVTMTVQRVLSADELAILNARYGIRGEIPVIPRAMGIELNVVGL